LYSGAYARLCDPVSHTYRHRRPDPVVPALPSPRGLPSSSAGAHRHSV